MKARLVAFLTGIMLPLAAFAANEGVPSYYQKTNTNANRQAYSQYANQGYTRYVGQSGQKQVVGTNTYTYQVPRATMPTNAAVMTPNGISVPVDENRTNIYAGYTRRFADFQFETGVNSVLEWDDMIFDEITVGARHNFSIRNFDAFAYAEYTYGRMESGGLSMDYDLAPFDWAYPEVGIFTISIGNQSGRSNHFRFGIGAHHVWDIAGWKLSPSIGYEIFKHNLEMSDHLYPNPGVYLPLMTESGNYVFGVYDSNNVLQYYSVPVSEAGSLGDEWFQVCMSPSDIMVIPEAGNGFGYLGSTLPDSIPYNPSWGYLPWGVGPDECVVIGGDGPILVGGTTHIYNTTWSGFYVGLEVEKQMTLKDHLRFYLQFGLPKYSSEGTWPNRDDWQQNPSFIDEGDNGAYSYMAEMEYNYQLSDRLKLALKVDTNYFHIGEIGGELYVAAYTDCVRDEDNLCQVDSEGGITLETIPAHTEHVTSSLKSAIWRSFGVSLGVKYAF